MLNIPSFLKVILDGKRASQQVCEYVDWLLSTYNPGPPDNGTWIKPSIHPCQIRHKDIQDTQADYIDLLRRIPLNVRAISAKNIYQKTTHSTVTF